MKHTENKYWNLHSEGNTK